MKAVGPSRRRTIRVLVVMTALLAVVWAWSGVFSLTLLTNLPSGADFDVALRYGALQVERRENGSPVPGGVDLKFVHFRYLSFAFWYLAPVADWPLTRGSYLLRLPLWIPTVVLVLVILQLNTNERRRPPHACAGCGYDRSEDPDSKCPECGRA